MRVWLPILLVVSACDLLQGGAKDEAVAAAEADAAPEKSASASKPKSKAKSKAEPKVKAGAETEAKPEPKAVAEPEPTPAPEPAPEPEPEPEPAPEAQPEPEAPPAEAPAAAEEAKPAEAGDGLAAAGSGSPKCIVGKWEAIDYRAVIDRAMNSDADLRKFSYSSSGGIMGYIVEEDGTVKQTAENVKFHLSGKVEGFKVNATVALDGENVAEYELVEPNIIKVAKPKEQNLKVKVSYAVKGITRGAKTRKLDLDFDGEFIYTCTEDKLTILNRHNQKSRPITFKRKP